MTPSEKTVVSLCKRAFLSLWTMANPVGKEPGKELCDALIVFNNDIVIISVKEILYKETEDRVTGWDRWNKSAIEKSIKQLKGAKRYLDTQNTINSKEHNIVFTLPTNDVRKYHLLTISLGAKREIPVNIPLTGGDCIHFIDEYCLDIIFSELDTVADFIEYLEKKEALFLTSKKLTIGTEEDIIGYYLWNNRTFPNNYDCIVFFDDIWEEIKKRPEYIQKKNADKVSFFWDHIIEEFINMRDPELNSIFGSFDKSNESFEFALRVLAKECRFSRRVLSQAFLEFHQDKSIASRVVESYQKGVFYVFLKKPTDYDRKARQIELLARCIIIRDKVNYNAVIVGIATEDDIKLGHSLDLLYYEKENWTEDDRKMAKSAMDDLRLFKSPRLTKVYADEYPNKTTT
jgi:hypothetical protein